MKLFFLCFIILSSTLFLRAEEDAIEPIVVSSNVDQNISSFFKLKLSKSILRAVSRQKGFYVVLSSNPEQRASVAIKYDVIVDIKEDPHGKYSLEAKLFSIPKQKSLLKISKKEIQSSSLLRDVEASVDLLFKTYNKKKKSSQTNKTISIQKGTQKKVKAHKNAFSQRKVSKAEKDLKEYIQQLDEKISLEKRKRINRLAKDQKDKEKNKDKESKPKDRKALASKGVEPLKPSDVIPLIADKYNLIALNVFSEDNSSQGQFIGVDYSANYIGVEYEGGRDILSSLFQLTYMFSYAKVFSDVTVQVPDYQVFGLGARKSFWMKELFLSSWISYESLGFINLPEEGKGLVAATNTLLWADVEAQFGFLIGKLGFFLRGGFGTSVASSSDYKPTIGDGLSGTRQKVALVVSGLAENISLIFRVQNRSLSGTSIEVDSQLVQGQVAYVF